MLHFAPRLRRVRLLLQIDCPLPRLCSVLALQVFVCHGSEARARRSTAWSSTLLASRGNGGRCWHGRIVVSGQRGRGPASGVHLGGRQAVLARMRRGRPQCCVCVPWRCLCRAGAPPSARCRPSQSTASHVRRLQVQLPDLHTVRFGRRIKGRGITLPAPFRHVGARAVPALHMRRQVMSVQCMPRDDHGAGVADCACAPACRADRPACAAVDAPPPARCAPLAALCAPTQWTLRRWTRLAPFVRHASHWTSGCSGQCGRVCASSRRRPTPALSTPAPPRRRRASARTRMLTMMWGMAPTRMHQRPHGRVFCSCSERAPRRLGGRAWRSARAPPTRCAQAMSAHVRAARNSITRCMQLVSCHELGKYVALWRDGHCARSLRCTHFPAAVAFLGASQASAAPDAIVVAAEGPCATVWDVREHVSGGVVASIAPSGQRVNALDARDDRLVVGGESGCVHAVDVRNWRVATK